MAYYILFIALFLFTPSIILASEHGYVDMYKNNIQVSVNISRAKIKGVSHINVRSGQELILNRGALEILHVRLNGKSAGFEESGEIIRLIPSDDGTLEIGFKGIFSGQNDSKNIISHKGIALTGIWYPQLEGLSYHKLEVTLPLGYEAISEAEGIKKIEDSEARFSFDFPYPLDSINLVAGNSYRIIKDGYNDVDIYAYFFEEDLELAERYIEYTKRYIEFYEELLGEFPYKRFSIVENFLPTGYSMPTFTLLGSSVVRLPFIVETSLGHEILHQWFGNMVYIDNDGGNWSEGITTYLSDHLYKEKEGRGWEYRKMLLTDYESYVNEDNEFPLIKFYDRFDDASKAIGYGKSSMVFHMVKNLIGEKVFLTSLRDFIKEYRFKRASWDDLRQSFERYYKGDLTWFFKQWVDEKGLPELELKDVELKYSGGGYELSFKLKQSGKIFRLDVPVTIYSGSKGFKRFFSLSEEVKDFKIYMSERPERMALDEDYDIARRLDKRETPPTISRLLGGREYLLALPIKNKEDYEYIIESFKDKGAHLKEATDIKESEIKSSTLIILGSDNPVIRRLFGRLYMPDKGFNVVVKKNPWDEEKVIGVFSGTLKDEIEAGFKKISHYGRYSRLVFSGGVNISKETDESERGIRMDIISEPSVVKVSLINSLSDIIDDIADKRIVYIGEFHDQYAHHTTQLEIIRRLYERNKRLAIGMEMFQRPFQVVIDDYTSGRIEEREFLNRSEYYKRWRFDFNLYKPILDFAVSKRVPVIALNMHEEIIDKVSENGIDSLTDKEMEMLPLEMDLSDAHYRERLKDIFKQHRDWEEKNFDYFFQSQIIWDETMAESIDEFLKKNPDYQMVVIAGQGHLEYGSGIPARTYRRNGYDYAIVLLDATAERGIADYIVFPEQIEAPSAPRLMAYLKIEDNRVRITGFPEDSISEKAGLKEGDIIIALDDVPVNSIEDIKLHLFYKNVKDVMRVKVQRREGEFLNEMEFRVKLK